MRKFRESANPTNVFTVEVSIPFPSFGSDRGLNEWLNIQYTGKGLIPFTEKVSDKHLEAAYNMHKVRNARLTIELNKKGDWKLLGAKFI